MFYTSLLECPVIFEFLHQSLNTATFLRDGLNCTVELLVEEGEIEPEQIRVVGQRKLVQYLLR